MLAGLARALTCGGAEGEVGNREGLSHHGQLCGEVVATLDSREAGLVIRFDLGTILVFPTHPICWGLSDRRRRPT
jgi:hypothetical protein